MFEELDKIILNHDIKEYNLKEGDRGTIVHVYGKGDGYEVEFFNAKGSTIAVLTLTPNDIRLISSEGEYSFHGFNSPMYASSAAGITYAIGAENVLRGFDPIFGIDEIKIKEESISKASIGGFSFSNSSTMNVKHIWSVLCKESVINQDDNNISIHGVLEQLSVSLSSIKETGKLPEKFGIPMNYEIVSMWQKSKAVEVAKAEIEYIFVDSENKELFKSTQMIEIPKTSRRFRSRMKITGMPLTKKGDYTFKVKIKEEESNAFKLVAELPLEIKINLEKPLVKSPVKN